MPTKKRQPVRRSPSQPATRDGSKGRSGRKQANNKRQERLKQRLASLCSAVIDYIPNVGFVHQQAYENQLAEFVSEVEIGTESDRFGDLSEHVSGGMPAHLARMCSTPLLEPEQEAALFQQMNYLKHRASSLRDLLMESRPSEAPLREAEECLQRSERIRNYLIQANTRLVMSIARRFADERNAFDDLLSHGIASLMHSVAKFDFSRGYRFSTYATCAVRRDLYRLVMNRKKDLQRYSTGAAELLNDCHGHTPEEGELNESSWNHLTSSLSTMMEQLDDRERFIVTCRFGLDESGKKASYSRMGERLGISKERVRQLANRALEKLRGAAGEHRLEALLS